MIKNCHGANGATGAHQSVVNHNEVSVIGAVNRTMVGVVSSAPTDAFPSTLSNDTSGPLHDVQFGAIHRHGQR